MKTWKQIFIAFLVVMLTWVAPAMAVTYVSSDPYYYGKNTDIDALGERLDASGPTQCTAVKVCNASYGNGGDKIYIGYSSSALSYAAGNTLSTSGAILYAVQATGETCTTMSAHTLSTGTMTYINVRNIYVEAAGANNQATYECSKYRQ